MDCEIPIEDLIERFEVHLDLRIRFTKNGVDVAYFQLPNMSFADYGERVVEVSELPKIRISIEKPKGGE